MDERVRERLFAKVRSEPDILTRRVMERLKRAVVDAAVAKEVEYWQRYYEATLGAMKEADQGKENQVPEKEMTKDEDSEQNDVIEKDVDGGKGEVEEVDEKDENEENVCPGMKKLEVMKNVREGKKTNKACGKID